VPLGWLTCRAGEGQGQQCLQWWCWWCCCGSPRPCPWTARPCQPSPPALPPLHLSRELQLPTPRSSCHLPCPLPSSPLLLPPLQPPPPFPPASLQAAPAVCQLQPSLCTALHCTALHCTSQMLAILCSAGSSLPPGAGYAAIQFTVCSTRCCALGPGPSLIGEWEGPSGAANAVVGGLEPGSLPVGCACICLYSGGGQ